MVFPDRVLSLHWCRSFHLVGIHTDNPDSTRRSSEWPCNRASSGRLCSPWTLAFRRVGRYQWNWWHSARSNLWSHRRSPASSDEAWWPVLFVLLTSMCRGGAPVRAGPRSRSTSCSILVASQLFPVSAASGAYPDSSSPGCFGFGMVGVLGPGHLVWGRRRA